MVKQGLDKENNVESVKVLHSTETFVICETNIEPKS